MTDIKTRARNALDDVQAKTNLVAVGTPDGGYQITTMDVRTAGLLSVAPTLIPDLLTALEEAEAERDAARTLVAGVRLTLALTINDIDQPLRSVGDSATQGRDPR